MDDQTLDVTYFAEPGPQNTDATLRLALQRASALSLKHVVVASDTGKTARLAIEVFHPKLSVVVVTNPRGVALPLSRLHDYLPRFQEHKDNLRADGVKTVACSLSDEVMGQLVEKGATVSRLDWRKLQAFTRGSLASVDRIGVATRVALTISTWACLSGRIPEDTEVVAVAGTGFGGGGADTAVIVRTAARFRDFRVMETIARPRVSPPSEVVV